jgi:predicted O-methyltransferase YrrM
MGQGAPSIIAQIEEKVQEIPGWSPVDQLYTLFNLAYFTPDLEGDIVEIGSWCGRSAFVLGLAARLTGNTRVHCVDLFPEKDDWRQNEDGSYSFEVEIGGIVYSGYRDQTVWKDPFERDIAPLYAQHRSVLEIFIETISRNHLQDFIRVYRGDSALFVRSVGEYFKCKLAFIDGDHSYEAVCRDIRNIDRFLVAGGWICFDDAFSGYAGVNEAIEDCVIKNPDYELGQQMTRKFFIARKKRGPR